VSSQAGTSDPVGRGGPAHARRLVTWLVGGAAAVVLLAAVAAAIALRTVDLSRLTGPIAAAVKSGTGRELTVGCGPHLRVSLSPSIVLEDVALSNAPWGSRKEMLRVKRVELRPRLLALLRGEVQVGRLLLVGPDLLLETDPSGRGNWSFAPRPDVTQAEAPGAGHSLASRLRVREVRVTDAVLAYRDGCAGWKVAAGVRRLTLVASRTVNGNLDVDGTLTLERANVSVTGAVGGLDAVAGGRPFPLKLAFSTNGATLRLDGTIQRVHDLAGVDVTMGLEVAEPAAFAPGALFPAFRIEGRLRDSGKAWVLDPVRAAAGASSVLGSVSYVSGCPRSTLAVVLRAPLLDLAELAGHRIEPADAPKAPATKGDKLFSTDPLPLGVLRAFDATADLRADALVLPTGTRVQALAVRIALAEERLEVAPLSMELGGGRISGSLRVDAGQRPSFAAKLTGRAVELRALLGLAGARADVEGAPTDLSVALAGSGASLHAWMAGLGGKVRVVVGPGRVEGAALSLGGDVLTQAMDTVNPSRKSDTSTELRCAVINVPVEGGVVRLDRRVAAETSKVNIIVGGTANLGTEVLDLGFRSKATQGLGMGLANFAGAVRVQGPFTSPRLGVDAEGAAAAANTVRSLFHTRGRSLFQDRVQDLLATGSPCKEALSEAPPPRPWPLSLFRKR
jgi:uncharacterized protein involved in outer membrane biogenesis